jgi:hypothetical protein
MTDTSKPNAPQAGQLSTEDLNTVVGGYLKLGDIKGERRPLGDNPSQPLKRERDEKGSLIITMEN